jgi:CRP-like cAMP-binding protein
VNSVGQLLEKNLAEFEKNLERYELELSELADTTARTRLRQVFREMRQTVEVISSGVSSMRGLSSVVTHRLDDINLLPKSEPEK